MCSSERDAALICKNGHLINGCFHTHPQKNVPFCSECGASTISECPTCHKEISGDYKGEFGYAIPWDIPKYCEYCGKPFPWTQSVIESISLIIQEESGLSRDLKQSVIESLPDVVSQTPRTELASIRMKKVLAGATSVAVDTIRQFIIDFGCELMKQRLGI